MDHVRPIDVPSPLAGLPLENVTGAGDADGPREAWREVARGGWREGRQGRGFTLIEVLVAVSVIAILAAMLFIGGKYASNHTRRNSTKVTLQNVRSMYAAMEARSGSGFYKQIYPDVNGNPATLAAPGDVSIQAFQGGVADRHGDAVNNTANLLGLLRRLTENQEPFSRLPNDQYMKAPSGNRSESTARNDPPVILDAWGNPIVFVPAGGLTGLSTKAGGTRSRIATDGKSFFVSGGADGRIDTDDDNVYSYED